MFLVPAHHMTLTRCNHTDCFRRSHMWCVEHMFQQLMTSGWLRACKCRPRSDSDRLPASCLHRFSWFTRSPSSFRSPKLQSSSQNVSRDSSKVFDDALMMSCQTRTKVLALALANQAMLLLLSCHCGCSAYVAPCSLFCTQPDVSKPTLFG